MALTLHTEITINATQEEIWTQLTDFITYPSWNPLITYISETPAKGNKLDANIAGMNFKPTVLEFIPNKKLVWLGKLLLKGLFDEEHCFEIIPQEHGCLFVQAEKFSGIIVPLFRKKLEIETKEGFQKMNIMLKQRVEAIN